MSERPLIDLTQATDRLKWQMYEINLAKDKFHGSLILKFNDGKIAEVEKHEKEDLSTLKQ